MPVPGWKDEDLLDYVEAHAKTELGLTHRAMVVRLYVLAGAMTLARLERINSRKFWSLDSETVEPLISAARARMRARG
jgi:hypothetical protein